MVSVLSNDWKAEHPTAIRAAYRKATALDEDELVLRAVAILQKKVERLREKEKLAPVAEAWDKTVNPEGTVTSSTLAALNGLMLSRDPLFPAANLRGGI